MSIAILLAAPIMPKYDANIRNLVDYLKNGNNFTPGEEQDFLYYNDHQNDNGSSQTTFGVSKGSAKSKEIRSDIGLLNSTVDMQDNSGTLNFNAKCTGVDAACTLGLINADGKIGSGELGGTAHLSKSGSELGFRANAQLASLSVGAANRGLSASTGVGLSVDTGARLRFDENWAIGGEIAGTGVTIGRTTKISLPFVKCQIKWY